MRNLLNTFIITILFANFLIGQENTNVDTNYLRPKIGDSILKSKIYRNGDKIIISKDEVEWNANNEKNIPTLFIYKNDYYYNFRAITDERNIFPIGYKLPSFYEINYLLNNQNLNKRNISFGSIDENGKVKAEIENSWCWIKDKYYDNIEFANTIHIKKVNYGFENELSVDLKVNGHVVFYLEDLSESIKTKTYDFRLLMPNKFKNFNQKILSIIPFPNNNSSNNSVNILAKIEFDRSGTNKSELLSLDTKSFNFKNEDLIKNNIQNTFKYYLQTPIYKNQFVSSFSDLNYKITYENLSKTYTSSSYSFAQISKIEIIAKEFNKIRGTADFDATNLLNKTISLKVFVEKQTKILSSNNTKIDSVNRFVLTKVKPMGSQFLAIVPGMGIGTLTNFSENHSATFKFLLFTSLPVGLISLGSYIYSNANYNKYKASSDFPSSLYNKANRAHKVFLTTASLYTLLSVIDFSISMNIKSKSRKLGRKINNTIDDKFNGAVELSNLIW